MGLENGLGPCVSSRMDSNICVLMRRDDSAFVGDLTRDSNWSPHKSVDSSRACSSNSLSASSGREPYLLRSQISSKGLAPARDLGFDAVKES
jgi:hypothetical protein